MDDHEEEVLPVDRKLVERFDAYMGMRPSDARFYDDIARSIVGEKGNDLRYHGACFGYSARFSGTPVIASICESDPYPSKLISQYVYTLAKYLTKFLAVTELALLITEFSLEFRLIFIDLRNSVTSVYGKTNLKLGFSCRINLASKQLIIRARYDIPPCDYFVPCATLDEIVLGNPRRLLLSIQTLVLSSDTGQHWVTLADTNFPVLACPDYKEGVQAHHTILLADMNRKPTEKVKLNSPGISGQNHMFDREFIEWFDMPSADSLNERKWSHETHLRLYRNVPFVMVAARTIEDFFATRIPSESEKRHIPVSQFVTQCPRPIWHNSPHFNQPTVIWPYPSNSARIIHFDLHARVDLKFPC